MPDRVGEEKRSQLDVFPEKEPAEQVVAAPDRGHMTILPASTSLKWLRQLSLVVSRQKGNEHLSEPEQAETFRGPGKRPQCVRLVSLRTASCRDLERSTSRPPTNLSPFSTGPAGQSVILPWPIPRVSSGWSRAGTRRT